MIESFLGFLAYSFRRVRNYANWRVVRGISELQIIAKASYFMLIFVPLLAATWPAVRLAVNQHNRTVAEATRVMEQATASFERAVSEVDALAGTGSTASSEGETFREAVDDFLAEVATYRDDFGVRTLDEPLLPRTWVRAFLAALLVAAGHLLYQLFAPETVRRERLADFIRRTKQDYVTAPSDLTLSRAREFIATNTGRREVERSKYRAHSLIQGLAEDGVGGTLQDRRISVSDARLVVEELGPQEEQLPDEYREILEWARRAYRPAARQDGQVSPEELSDIERGANVEYLVAAERNPLAVVATVVLYASGIYLMVLIVGVQIRAVLHAAGLENLWGVFAS